MNRITGRVALTVAATGAVIAAVAGTASASPSEFLTDLGYLGYAPSQGGQDSAIKLGYAICNELADGKSHADVMQDLENGPGGWSSDKSAAWVAAAADGLCSQYK